MADLRGGPPFKNQDQDSFLSDLDSFTPRIDPAAARAITLYWLPSAILSTSVWPSPVQLYSTNAHFFIRNALILLTFTSAPSAPSLT